MPASVSSGSRPISARNASRFRSRTSRIPLEDALGERPRRFDELRIVQQHQRLQRRDRGFAPGDADLARRGVERGHRRRRRGPPPEGVEAAAIELRPGVLRVGLAGAGLLPQPGRLIRLDARAADGPIQQPAGGERAVADLFRQETRLRPAGQQLVVRIARHRLGGRDGGLAERRRQHDAAVQRFQVPALRDRSDPPTSRAAPGASAACPGCRSPRAWRRGRGRSACARRG